MNLFTQMSAASDMNESTLLSNLKSRTFRWKSRMSTGWTKNILVVILPMIIMLGHIQVSAQCVTCPPSDNSNTSLWSDECYYNNTCGLQGNPCTANDVRLIGVYIADANGDPIPACNIGDMQTVTLWGNFNNNTGTDRYAIRSRTSVIVNNVCIAVLNSCSFDILPSGTDSVALLGSFSYTCGDQIALQNTWVAWNTSAAQCSDPMGANYAFDCGDYSPSKCYKNLGFIEFLTPNFSYDCGDVTSTTTEVCFMDLSSGGNGPITQWSWDFGDSNTSTQQNPCHIYNATSGMFTVTLTVTDSAGNTAGAFLEINLANLNCCLLTLSCPPANGGTFACSTQIPAADTNLVVVLDSCGPVTTTVQNSQTGSGCGLDTLYYTRLYIATDGTNTDTCTQIFKVRDSVAPGVSCPPNVTVQCNTSTAPASTGGSATSTDNCDLTPTVTFTDVTTAGGCPQEFTITRTWRATDDCNNSSTCNQIITVDDSSVPSITCPLNVTVQCASLVPAPAPGSLTVSDNCDPNPAVTHVSDVTVNQTCTNRYTLNRTYRATDACGNSATCLQTITVFDGTLPSITCPAGVTVQCASQVPAVNTASVTTNDNCGGTPTVTHVGDVTVNQTCTNRYTLNRTYRAMDACGNSATCVQVITVFDNTIPMIACPGNVTVQCASLVPPVNIAGVTASDNCGGTPTITHVSDVTVNQSCADRYTLNRTYRATDECGNSATCLQVITVFDNIIPNISCPLDMTVECDADTSTTALGTATATDNCGAGVTISHTDFIGTPPVGGQGMQWVYLPPGTMSGTCTSGSNCATNTLCFGLQYTPGTTGTLTSYTTGFFVDCYNGNDPILTNVSCVMTDNSLETADCGGSGTVLMNSSGNNGSLAVTQNTPVILHQVCFVLGAGANILLDEDELTDLTTSIDLPGGGQMTETPTFTNYTVDFNAICGGGCNFPSTIYRQFSATDDCGNVATCIQTITLEDTTPPNITCPNDVTVQCAGNVPAPNIGSVTATDNCSGTPVITFLGDITTSQTCVNRFTVSRTYRATDACGNSSTCEQIITVFDNTLPSITCPANVTVQCASLVPPVNTAGVTASDNCGGIPVVAHVSDVTVNQTCVNRYILNRTYSATDACGNTATCIQVITVFDNTPPVITNCIADVTVQCANLVPAPNPGAITATDNCGGMTSAIHLSDVTVSQTCANQYVLNRTYRASDECGNSATCVQVITVFDNTVPSIICPNNVTVQCASQVPAVDPTTVTASDNCGGVPTVTHVSDVTVNQTCVNRYTLNRTYRATDACGNSATCLQVITVFDNTAPSITCPIDVTVQCASLVPAVNIAGVTASDNCGGTPSVSHLGDVTVSQTCVNRFTVNRTYRAIDACGNSATCVQVITVFDNTAPTINCPANITLQCANLVPAANFAAQGGTASDNCGGTPSVTHLGDVTVSQSCLNQYVLNRTYRAMDECGNSATCVQVISVFDNTAPSITCPGDVTVQCANLVPPVSITSVTASDNCGGTPVVTHVGDVTVNQTCLNRYTLNRTYRATDACGNSATCVQVITVFDNTVPTINCPVNVTVQCANLVPAANFAGGTASDNCGGTPVVTHLGDVTVSQTCTNQYVLNRTYRAIDECGNSATCIQVITVFDNTVPTLTCPINVTVQCASLVPAANFAAQGGTASDNCGGTPNVIHVGDVTVNQTCLNRYTLNRTYRATDECGNSATCVQVITVFDNTVPSITCPNNVTVQCASLVPPVNIAGVTASDNCNGIPVITHVGDVTVNQTCLNRYTLNRTYRATDECGNSATCVQVITVFDNTTPTINCPVNITVQCANLVPAANFAAQGGTASDNCGGTPAVTHLGDVTVSQTCLNQYVLNRTYRAMDECGNSATCVQVITVFDNTVPTITCPGDVTVQCASLVPPVSITSVTASDNCGGTPVVTHVGDVTVNQTCLNRYTLNRTYRATDACGNSATCVQVITVFDNTVPTINCPANVTVQCANLVPAANFAGGTAGDNCGGTPVVSHLGDVTVSQTCTNQYVLNRTYRAIDECGNSATCVQVITVFDNTPPSITCPANVTVQCASLVPAVNLAGVTASDNCNGIPVITHVGDVTVNQTCVNRYTLNRTYRATDECGNSATCLQVITVFDNTAPSITCPNNVTVQCASLVPPVNIAGVTASDNCNGIPVITHVGDVTVNQTCVNRYTLNRTYRATDECGNSATCLQVITVFDNTAPTITCPANVTVQCANLVPAINFAAQGGTASDNCGGTPTVTHVSDVTVNQTCVNRYTLNRTYRATDECGNSATCLQVITVFDNTVPTITCPFDVTVQCANLVPAVSITSVIASDNCGGAPVVTHVGDVTVNQTCINRYTLNRTYRATDECGNSATCLQVITVFDNTIPTINCPANVTVQCASLVPAANFAAQGGTASDNCGGTPVVTHVGDVTVNQTCINRYTLNRTYRATDECGNSATCLQVITVFDNTAPIISCPPNITVQCASQVVAVNVADVTVSDNCGGIPVVTHVSDVTVNQTCLNRYTLNRTYRATDACGNSATCVQVITVFDNTVPSITCPNNVTVQCASLVPPVNIAGVTASDNCNGIPVITHVGDVTVNQTCVNRYTLNRTYRATDECGNSATCLQVITVFDNTPPSITCPANVTVQCANLVPAPNPGAVTSSDNCNGTPVVTHVSDVTVNQTCINRYTLNRTYRATDECGNSATCLQVITVFDNTVPTITCPGNVTVQCAFLVPPVNITSVIASDNCGGAPVVTHVGDVTVNQTCINRYTLNRTYRATDACGNSATCVQVITVFDNTAPIISCPPNITVQCASQVVPVNIADVTVSDNCNGIPTVTHVSDVTVNQTCVNRYTLNRTYRATDECGNSATCVQVITVFDNTPPVLVNPQVDCSSLNTFNSPPCYFPATGDIGPTLIPQVALLYQDNCGAPVIVTYGGTVPGPNNGPCSWSFTFNYIISDNCGNSTSCSVVYSGEDTTPPIIFCPGPLQTQCSIEDVPPYTTLAQFVAAGGGGVENCFINEQSFGLLSEVSDGNTCPEVVTRTYVIADQCGNTGTCTQTITIDDTIAPEITCPDDVTLNCNDSTDPFVITFTNETDYLNTTGMINMESFEGEAAPDFTNVVVVTDFTLVMLPDLASCGVLNFPIDGMHATDGVNYVLDQTDSGGTATFTFNAPINTFGLNLTDWGDFGGGTLTFSNNAGDMFVVAVAPQPNANEMFFGVINSMMSFTQVVFTQTTDGESFGIDEVYYGTPLITTGPTVDDNCDPNPTVIYADATIAGNCPEAYTIQRTWTATDDCGNSSTCLQILTIVDATPPVIVCPSDMTLECDASTSPDATGVALAGDNCDDEVTISSSDFLLEGNCAYNYTLLRTWTAMDNCGNSSTCVQTIVVEDTTPPDMTCPPNITISCDDSTDPSVMVITDEQLFLDMLGPLSLESFEGNPTGFTNTIVTTPFTLDLDPPFAINGVYNFPLGGAHATDGVKYVYNQTDAGGTATFTFNNDINCFGLNITDWGDFMNGALSFSNDAGDNFTISITFLPDANEQFFGVKNASMNFNTVTLTQSSNGDNYGIDEIYYGLITTTGGPEVTDNCDPAPDVSYNDVTIEGECAQEATIQRTWTATDACGNSTTCLQIISIQDTGAPVIGCPENVTVSCADEVPPVNPGSVTTFDNCDPAPIVTHVSDVTVNQTCTNRYTLQRTYQATDDCGNSATCMQIITVFDAIQPVISCPNNVTIQCNTSTTPDATGLPSASDNCDQPVVLPEIWINEFHYDNTGTDAGEFIEVAGPAGTNLAIYSIVLYNGTGGAPYDTDPLVGTIDNETAGFGAVSLAYPVNGIQNGAPDGIALVKNGTTVIQFISYEGSFVAVGGPANGMMSTDIGVSETGSEPVGQALRLTGAGNEYNDFTWASPSAASPGSLNPGQSITALGGPDITYSDVTVAGGTCAQEYTILRTWTATDDCANSSTCLQIITIDDSMPPTITCPANVTVQCASQVPPVNIAGVTASDNCDGTPTITHVSDVTVNQTCINRFTLNRTYRATDDCGNSATCVQVITVFDNTPPSITCPANITVQCANLVPAPSITTVTASDNCNGTPVITHVSDVTVNQTCVNRYMLNRTYRATDECGNSATCVQVITVFDDTPPSITCPANVSVQCANQVPPVNIANVTASDNCNGVPVITHVSDVTVNQTCVNRYTLNRTYRATDECGNSATCLQVITVFDSTPPSITCPANVTVQCASQVPPVNIAGVNASDNCSGIPVITHVSDVTVNQTCINRYTLNRTYRATDECGNSATCLQVITVFDNTPPSITCPINVTVQCASQVPPVDITTVTASDNCNGVPVITHVSDVTVNQTCINRYTLNRTYRATDECGNSATCLQVITVFDNTPPSITCPANVTVQCANQVPPVNIAGVTASDNCNGVPVITHVSDVTVNQTCVNRYTLNRTYRATDECGNSATCLQVITVFDNTPPSITCPANITVQCANQVPAPSTTSVTASDNCNGSPIITHVSDVTVNQTCVNRYTLNRTYRATDECGNSATCLQVITVFDNTPPSITCPINITVQCANQVPTPNPGSVTTSDNCNGVPVVTHVSDVTVNQTCVNRYTLNRTYRATDECGNSATCLQVITVFDNTPPSITCPANVTVQCASQVPPVNIAGVTASDNCSGIPVITHVSDVTVNQTCINRYTLNRTYRATDECGNSATCLQVITVFDNTPPSITCPANVTVQCASQVPPVNIAGVTASDNCNGVPVITHVSDVTVNQTCINRYTLNRTYRATDECGNSATCLQVITVFDNTPPSITCPANVTVQCANQVPPVNIAGVTASDNCNGVPVITHVSDVTVNQTCVNRYTLNRTYRATDECGNSATCLQVITVFDNTPPTITCPANITVQCANLVPAPSTTSVTASDNCNGSPVITHVSDVTVNQTCVNRYTLNRTYRATDECGNSATCLQVITVFDNTPPAITCPANITVQCANQVPTPNPSSVTTSDNCSGTPVVTHVSDVTVNQTCVNRYTLNRTYRATDECGNSATCLQVITVFDNTPPSITCPINVTVQCASQVPPVNIAGVIASDNCSGIPVITHVSDVTVNQTCINRYTLNRTYRATDECGNSATCLQVITVFDNTPPSITCPANVTVQCANQVPPVNIAGVTASDNCNGLPVVTHVSDVTVNQTCVNRYTLNRTYRATDECGNSATCLQVITVFDNTVPSITCPQNITIQCANQVPTPNPGSVTTSDNCNGIPVVTHVSDVTVNQTCLNRYILRRTYRATDECGNSATCLQIITVFDNTIPLITCAPDVTIECDESTLPDNTGMTSATDNCSGPVLVTYSDVTLGIEFCSQEYFITRTWQISDACGNSTACVQQITVVDDTPPVIDCPEDVTLECNQNTSPGCGVLQVSTFTDESQFLNASGALGLESFEANPPNVPQSVIVTPGFTLTLSPAHPLSGVYNFTQSGAFATHGTNYIGHQSPFNSGGTATFNFNSNINSFGINLTDWGDFGVGTLTFLNSAGDNFVVSITPQSNGNQQFFGIVNPNMDFNQVVFTQSIFGEGYGMDEIYFGMSSITGCATATDNCDNTPFVAHSDVVVPGQCAQEMTIYRTWTATDDCLNASTCLQIISVQDNTPPTFTECPTDVTIECDESTSPDVLGVASATDMCDEEVVVTSDDVTIEGPCPQSYTIERTWTAVDDCGNESTCLQIITVEDTTPPTFVCAENVTIECDESTLPTNTGFTVGSDNCDPDPEETYLDNIIGSENCPEEYLIIRIWTITDACDNSSVCTQTILVVDTTPPVLDCADNVTIECTESTLPDNTGITTATDNCDELVIPDYSDVTIEGNCPQEYTIVRTWTASDDCGNTATCEQIIFVDDSTPPSITCPLNITVQCASNVPAPNPAGVPASDNCGIPVVTHISDVTVNQTCINRYLLNRTYRATDECGNSATCLQVITVFDNTVPSITCPFNITVQCANQVPTPNPGSVTASDNCNGVPVVTHVSDVTVNQTCVNRYTLIRTYRATDECGNSATCQQAINVFDSTPPSITCPANITVQCAINVPAPNPASVTASDNCSGVPVVTHVSDVTVNQTCVNRYTLERTYRATDECGNSSTCLQVITVFDNTPPSITCPANITVTCATQVPAPNTASVTTSDNCTGGVPVVTHVSDVTVNQVCVNRFTLNRTYRATDVCGNSATCVQIITVFDNVPPSLTCPANITVTCATQVPAPNPAGVTATDNCTGPAPIVTHVSDVTVNQTCFNRYLLNRTYRATDACGNSATCIQVITVFDNVPPTITCPPNITVQCAVQVPVPNPALVTTSDNCTGPAPVVTFVSDVTVNQTCLNRYTLNRTYRSTDACGNSATCVQVITVFDNTPPTIAFVDPLLIGVPNGGTIEIQCYGQDPEWDPPMFGPNSVMATDNCTGPVTVSYDETLIDEGDCEEDGYINRYRLRWIATDACGNSSSATVFVNLVDHIPPVILGVPEDITVNCDEVPDQPTLMAVDECLCACVVELAQQGPYPGCQNGQVIIRSWKATDDCGNMTIETQSITLVDTEGPELTIIHPELEGVVDGTILEYTCNEGGIPDFYDDLTAEDVYSPYVCDGFPNITFDHNEVISRNCKYFGYIEQRTYTWTGTDDCGNQTTLTIYARLVDDEPPVIIGAPDMACVGDPALKDVEAVDNCEVAYLTYWDVEIPSPCGSGTAYRRTWEANDPCGNYTRDTTILIQDDIAPVIYFTNPDLIGLGQGEFITTECDDSEGYFTNWGLNDVYAEDDCPGVNVEFEQIVMQDYGCEEGTVVWLNLVWTATDLCGNSSSLYLYVYVEDHTPPTINAFDPEVTIGCNDELPEITADDNCSEATVTIEEKIIKGNCEFVFDVMRTITATDACGNVTTATQLVHVGDGSGPIISGVVEELCDDLTIPEVTAWDPCAETFVPVTMTQDTLESPCQDGLVIERIWSATDVCGNVTEVHQLIYINDHTPPVIQIPTWSIILWYLDQEPNLVYLSQQEIMDRLNELNEGSVYVVDDCDELIIPEFSVVVTYSDNCEEDGYYERRVYTWIAIDPCGNSTVISFTIDIMDDIAPVISGNFEDLTVICDQLPPPTPVTVTDYGTPVDLEYTQEIGPDNGQGHFIVIRTWTATDPCGNVTVVRQSILWIPDTFISCDIILPDEVECNTHGVPIGSNVEGGIGPFTYEWEIVGEKCFIQNGQGTGTIDIYIGFTEVQIFLTVTDAYGCTGVCSAILDCIDPFDDAFTVDPNIITPDAHGPTDLTPSDINKEYLRSLNYWPNPANSTVNVRFESAKAGEVEMSFINYLGQTVLLDQMNAAKGFNFRKLDVSLIPDGTYLLQVKTENEIHVKTIVIMKKG